MKETMAMWWAKLLMPMAFAITSGLTVYFYQHEIRTDEIEQNLTLLNERVTVGQKESDKFFNALEKITVGLDNNSKAIIALNHQVSEVIKKNNVVIERLLNAAEKSAERNSRNP